MERRGGEGRGRKDERREEGWKGAGKGGRMKKGVGRQETAEIPRDNNQLSSLLSFEEAKETHRSHSLATRPPGFGVPFEPPNPYYVCMKQAASPLT